MRDLKSLRALFLRKADLLRRIEALEAEAGDLRARLVAAQNAKALAESQTEELRDEKERLRARVAAQKKAATQEKLVTEQLRAKFEALQEEHRQLALRLKALERSGPRER